MFWVTFGDRILIICTDGTYLIASATPPVLGERQANVRLW